MENFNNLYNHDGIIRYVQVLTEKRLPVYIWTHDSKGNPVTGDAYVMGQTTIIRNGEEKEVVMLSLTGELDDCFGLPFISFIHNAGVPKELYELYQGCFNLEQGGFCLLDKQ